MILPPSCTAVGTAIPAAANVINVNKITMPMTSFSNIPYPNDESKKIDTATKTAITSNVDISIAKTLLTIPAVTNETAAVAIYMSSSTDMIKSATARCPSFL